MVRPTSSAAGDSRRSLLTQCDRLSAIGSGPRTLTVAGLCLCVLTPLAYAKRRLGRQLGSRALQGDGSLSAVGAATSLLALAALVLYHAAGWWWADRVAALVVAAIAGAQAWQTMPRGYRSGRAG